jgi:hypothetical protein
VLLSCQLLTKSLRVALCRCQVNSLEAAGVSHMSLSCTPAMTKLVDQAFTCALHKLFVGQTGQLQLSAILLQQ